MQVVSLGDRLVTLDLAKNGLTKLPRALGDCAGLRSLVLADNALAALPAVLQKLSLTSLVLANNKLSNRAFDMCRAQNHPLAASLKTLDLNRNDLASLPEWVFDLAALTSLSVAANRLTALEPHLPWARLGVMQNLDLSNNHIADVGTLALAVAHGALPLRSIDLSNNDIRNLPLELGLCTNVGSLQLHGNPQRTVRTNVMSQGTGPVLQVLRRRLPEGFELPPLPHGRMHTQQPPPSPPPPPHQQPGVGGRGHGAFGAPSRHDSGWDDLAVGPQGRPTMVDQRGFDATGAGGGGPGPALSEFSPMLAVLDEEIAQLDRTLENGISMSQARRYALKKQLAMKKAARIKEERRVRAELT